MGTGFRGPFKEIWDAVGPIFNECRRTGNSVAVSDQMLPIERHGFREETFFTVLTPFLAPIWTYDFSQQLLVIFQATLYYHWNECLLSLSLVESDTSVWRY